EVLGKTEYRTRAVECALKGAKDYENAGKPWPCGTIEWLPDPGLLLGEAGIGLFMLRAANSSIPSVLFVDSDLKKPADTGPKGYAEARQRFVEGYFGCTLRVLASHGVDTGGYIRMQRKAGSGTASPVESAFRAISDRVASEADAEKRAIFEDAFLLDRRRYLMAAAPPNFAAEFLEALQRPALEEIDWAETSFELSPKTRIVRSEPYLRWQNVPPTNGKLGPWDALYALHCRNGKVYVHGLTHLSALVLTGLNHPSTVSGVVAFVSNALSETVDRCRDGWLWKRVRSQLEQAYRSGMVDVARRPSKNPSGRAVLFQASINTPHHQRH
ncbi:MAG: hypothetical protein P8X94_10480, partial [Woeseiaceae bacterium]